MFTLYMKIIKSKLAKFKSQNEIKNKICKDRFFKDEYPATGY